MSATLLNIEEWLLFIEAIRSNPDDDTTRGAAADWLRDYGTETDQPALFAWGDFINAQIEVDRGSRDHVYIESCDCEVCRPERRSAMLFDRWGDEWRRHWPVDRRQAWWFKMSEYSRGFLPLTPSTLDVEPVLGGEGGES